MPSKYRAAVIEIPTAALLAAANCACGGRSVGTISPPPGISVAITPSAITVQPGATSQLVATVNNDSNKSGVTWKVSCSSTPCGTLSSASTASGARR